MLLTIRRIDISVPVICFCFLLSNTALGQAFNGQIEFTRIPVPSAHYTGEYTFDSTLNAGAWKKEIKGMHVSFASTDELYFRSEVPVLENASDTWQGTGWKGERLNAV